MINKILCLSFFFTLLTTNVLAAVHPCEFSKETVEDVYCHGPAKLVDTTIKGILGIDGELEANHSVMTAAMDIGGNAKLNDTNMKSDVTVAGKLISKHGTFEGNLIVISDKVTLNATTVKGSVIFKAEQKKKTPDNKEPEKDNKIIELFKVGEKSKVKKEETAEATSKSKEKPKEPKTPVIILVCATKISGNIIFKGKSGIIKKSSDSTIEGTIKNGRIELYSAQGECK